ncbi:hypothetical protein N656DRAFT_705940 [Canariomyces notabilis]|uniref:Uncharacterized protein n=1 Tax=Canariomyces notabilis TaxID=2074819 RepID=A0AAN6YV75_9PEZI|nr:hypothetical protein N656DRAFT_705940 [Canariomyces arenarius]
MLDENLPTFRLKRSSENPLSSILYFTHNGSDPSVEYLLRRPDPALPASHNKYAVALCDPYNPEVVYGEVLVEPEWTQPTLSAAEIRAQAQSGAPPAQAMALVPDSFTIQLYNPDQAVAVKMVPGTWNKSDSWEFDLPTQTFRKPTTSELDREHQNTSPAVADLTPRIMFRWKKDGRLSKDMTCSMCGTRLGTRKNKEPDITIAMFRAARESIMTVYQPNLHRVDLEDRKGLEIVLLLGSEVIKDLYLMPKVDIFNVQGGAPVSNGKRKNSRPAGSPTGAAPMSGALAANIPPSAAATTATPATRPSAVAAANSTAPSTGPASNPEIEAETRRLQAMVEREERERRKAELAEQKRIQKMIQEEEKERRRREAEIEKETERLRKKFGVEGQQLPSDRPPLPPRAQGNAGPSPVFSPPPHPHPPPHKAHHSPNPQQQQGLSPWGYPTSLGTPAPALPPRPVSAEPYSRPSASASAGGGQGQQLCQQMPHLGQALGAVLKGAAGQLQQLQSRKRSSHW